MTLKDEWNGFIIGLGSNVPNEEQWLFVRNLMLRALEKSEPVPMMPKSPTPTPYPGIYPSYPPEFPYPSSPEDRDNRRSSACPSCGLVGPLRACGNVACPYSVKVTSSALEEHKDLPPTAKTTTRDELKAAQKHSDSWKPINDR